jgi:hypothetical protein
MGACEAAAEENGEADWIYWLSTMWSELLAPKAISQSTHVILEYLP